MLSHSVTRCVVLFLYYSSSMYIPARLQEILYLFYVTSLSLFVVLALPGRCF